MHRFLTIALVLLLASFAMAHTLTVNVVDDATGLPLAFRGHCIDAAGDTLWPLPDASCYKHVACSGGVWPIWWLGDGSCEITVSEAGEGAVTIGAGCGFEYRPVTTTVNVTADTETTLRLTPLTDMSTLGWYSGDTEADLSHPPVIYTCDATDALFNCRAEGMNVFNAEGGPAAIGTVDTEGDRVCFTTYELRHQRLGHLCPLGAIAAPDSTIWAINLAPTLYDIADSMAAAGPSPKLVILQNHPSEYKPNFRETVTCGGTMWPREAIVDAHYGKLDAYDMMFLSDGYTAVRYHHILSSGIKLTATGGTDSALSAVKKGPTGSIKTYAYTPDFDYWEWIAAIDAGRTFATNGPLFTEWTVGGEMPGTTIAFDNLAAETLPIVVAFDSAYPVKRLDYLVNGSRVGGRVFTTAKTSWDTTDASGVTVEHGGAWVSGRLVGDDAGWFTCARNDTGMVAETSPVYVTMAGLDANVIGNTVGPDYCADWCDSLIKVTKWMHTRVTATWATSADSARALGLYRDARTAYNTKAGRAVYTVGGGGDYADLWAALDPGTGCNADDTLIMLEGTHAGAGARAVPDGVTIRSLGPDYMATTIIRNLTATTAGITTASTLTLRDLTFRTNLDITNPDVAVVHGAGANVELAMYNCAFRKCIATQRHSALFMNVAESLHLEDVAFDSCGNTGADMDYSVAYILNTKHFTWDGGRITNCTSVDRAPFPISPGVAGSTVEWDNILIADNSSANYGIVWFTGGQAGDVFYLDHITIADNACTDNADGALVLEGGNLFSFKHSIISGGGSLVAFKATSAPDTMHYCDLYGNGADVAYGDTTNIIKVDPEYITTDLASPSAYKASSEYPKTGTSSVRKTADGSYMGWLQPPALAKSGHGRRRRH